MAYGVQIFNAGGSLLWDSSVAGSGIVADVLVLPAGGPWTYTYPDFAGRTVNIVALVYLGTTLATVDTALGYPRVTVPNDANARTFLVVAF